MTATLRAAVAFAIVTSAAACKHDREIVADKETRAIVHPKDVRIELVEVADDVDLLESVGEVDLPKGVRVMAESAPIGLEERGGARYSTTHYARFMVQANEDLAAANLRIHSWLDPIAARAEVRIATGAWLAYSGEPKDTDPNAFRTYALRGAPLVTQADFTAAKWTISDYDGAPYVEVTLSAAAAKRYADETERLAKRRVAIVIDGLVEVALVIQTRIAGGHLQLVFFHGDRTAQFEEAKRVVAGLHLK